jgi:hypothetical protein
MNIEVFDKTSLLNRGIYPVLEELDNGYFISCHGNGREFVLKEHVKIIPYKVCHNGLFIDCSKYYNLNCQDCPFLY